MTSSVALEHSNSRAFEARWKEHLCSMAKAPEYEVLGTRHRAQLKNFDQLEERPKLHNQVTCHEHQPRSDKKLSKMVETTWEHQT